MHVAPLDRVKLGPDSIYRFRCWLTVGDEVGIAKRLEALIAKYSQEQAELARPEPKNSHKIDTNKKSEAKR